MERRGSIHLSFDTDTKEEAVLILENLANHLRHPNVIPKPAGYFNPYAGNVATLEEIAKNPGII